MMWETCNVSWFEQQIKLVNDLCTHKHFDLSNKQIDANVREKNLQNIGNNRGFSLLKGHFNICVL